MNTLTVTINGREVFARAMDDNEAEPFARGFADGYERPDDLSSGMTYEDARSNEAYDSGVNFGQVAGRWPS